MQGISCYSYDEINQMKFQRPTQPITDQCALTVPVWVDIKVETEGDEDASVDYKCAPYKI